MRHSSCSTKVALAYPAPPAAEENADVEAAAVAGGAGAAALDVSQVPVDNGAMDVDLDDILSRHQLGELNAPQAASVRKALEELRDTCKKQKRA